MTEKHTERTMLDKLNRKYGTYNGNGHRYSRAEHVKISTGFDSPRVCDYMAIDLYNGYGPTAGPKLHGHEVKVSRSDWLTELKDPSKAEAFAQYCDYWWLVVSDKDIVKDGELPKGWGLMAVRGSGLTVVKQAIRRPDPLPMGRPLQATLTRAVTKTAVRLAHTEDGAIHQIRQRMKPHPDQRGLVTPDQIRAVIAATRRRALLEAAKEIPQPEAAQWLREKAEQK